MTHATMNTLELTAEEIIEAMRATNYKRATARQQEIVTKVSAFEKEMAREYYVKGETGAFLYDMWENYKDRR